MRTARLPIAPLFPCLLGLRLCFLRHRLWYLLPIAPAPKPVVQLLVRNLHTHLPPTPRHRLPYRPKLPFRYRLPHPPLLLLRPYLWPHSLSCASLPSLYPHPHTTSPTAEYAHALRLPPLSPASIAPLVSTSTAPAISCLSDHLPPACKAGKTLLRDAFKLSSMAVPYLPALCVGAKVQISKNTPYRKWYNHSGASCLYHFQSKTP